MNIITVEFLSAKFQSLLFNLVMSFLYEWFSPLAIYPSLKLVLDVEDSINNIFSV